MASINYPLLLIFALAPSLIWLAFYLRKDAHPEPNRMILTVFLAGMLVTILAFSIENFLEGFFSSFSLPAPVFLGLYFFLGIALVEEFLKYLVVRISAFSSSALDEPLDVMLYMVISALGFSAMENIFLLFKLIQLYPISGVFLVNAVRFVEAILLHALVSGLFGYFLAISYLREKHAWLLFFGGLASATLLHGLFNFYIFTRGDQGLFSLLLPVIPLLGLALFISFAFRRLRNMKSIYPSPIQRI